MNINNVTVSDGITKYEAYARGTAIYGTVSDERMGSCDRFVIIKHIIQLNRI